MFHYDITTPLTEEELNEKLDAIAKEVVGRRLESPAIMFLEMHKPLSYIASQGVILGMPFFGPLIGHQRMADFSKILQDSGNVEKLIVCIENMAAARDAAEEKAEDKKGDSESSSE